MKDIAICGGLRTINGKFLGGLKEFGAVDLGKIVLREFIRRNNDFEGIKIGEVIMSICHAMGMGPNASRQCSIGAGLPDTIPAWNLNSLCGSGIKAMNVASQIINSEDAEAVLIVGTESMTNVPHLLLKSRMGYKLGSVILEDSLVYDGFMDPFVNQMMGATGENVAERFNISREEQDIFAYNSHMRAANAVKLGLFDEEIFPVEANIGKNEVVKLDKDESIRGDTTIEKLAKLKPFFKEKGTITAGNSCPISDGAAVIMLADYDYAVKNNLPIKAIIRGFSYIGMEPAIMGFAPAPAIKALLKKIKLSVEDIDLFEINEAFASQVLAVAKDLDLDLSKVNPNGGGIALGHPTGQTGVRIVLTLMRELKRTNKKIGIASLCSGGGMGNAICIEVV
jgi:acetyl-CoA C-acetyltransferase